MMAAATSWQMVMSGVLMLEAMQAMITSASCRHSCIVVASLGVPSKMLMAVKEEVLPSSCGNALMSFDLERTKMFRVRSSGVCESSRRRMAEPVEPVAPSKA